MMTVITETTLEPGQEAEWDQAFQERLAAARQQPGWIGVQLLIPVDDPDRGGGGGTRGGRGGGGGWAPSHPFPRSGPRV